LAFGLSRDVAVQLGASIPKLYDYVANLAGGDAMARAPDTGAALAAIRGGDISRSLEATAHLESQFPNEMAARALRAQALLLAWDADPSAQNSAAFNEAVAKLEALEPHNPYAEFYRAYLAYGRADMKTALELFATLLQRDDLAPAARAWVMRYRAMVLGATGDRSGSLHAMEDALTIDPANAWTLAALASILSESGRYDEALERARQATVLNPLGWRNHLTLGLALAELKRFDEAASAFATACIQSKAQFACALEAVALQHATKRRGRSSDPPHRQHVGHVQPSLLLRDSGQ
jgi:tetratricopeptide (TPR) repeat protein